jgi:hypothetical protein
MMEKMKRGYFKQPKDYLIAAIGFVGGIYLLNFSFGVTELLPDALPVLGHIDEGVALFIVYSSLTYFNIHIDSLFKRKSRIHK